MTKMLEGFYAIFVHLFNEPKAPGSRIFLTNIEIRTYHMIRNDIRYMFKL